MNAAGIDENGLGPLLGPLIVTGVSSNVPHERLESLKQPSASFPGLQDSKKIFTQRNLARGEALALSIIKVFYSAAPSSMLELLHVLHCEAAGTFPLPCLKGETGPLCMAENLELPLWSETADIEVCAQELGSRLEQAGFEKGHIVSALWCPFLLNREMRRGRNKFSIDLETFLDVASVFRSICRGPLDVVAGKIGSRTYYEEELQSRYGSGLETLCRTRDESAYRIGDGTAIRFIHDADDKFVHVSMASIIGKYAREVFMEAVYRFATQGSGRLRRPSGYRDRISKEFIREVKDFLLESGVSPDCFERIK